MGGMKLIKIPMHFMSNTYTLLIITMAMKKSKTRINGPIFKYEMLRKRGHFMFFKLDVFFQLIAMIVGFDC